MIQPSFNVAVVASIIAFLTQLFLYSQHAPASGKNSAVKVTNSNIDNEDWGPTIAEEVSLPKHHQEVLLSDGPFSEIFLPEDDSVWLFGQSSLWQWDLERATLSRVNLRQQLGDQPLKNAALSQLSLFVTSNQALAQLQFDPKRVFIYHPPDQGPGEGAGDSLKLIAAKDKLWWIAKKTVYSVDRYGKTLKATALAYPLSHHDYLAADLENQVLYIGRSTKVFSIDLQSKPQKVSKIYDAPESIRSLAFENGQIVTSTQHVVVRINLRGEIQQSVPVEGNQSLVKSHFSQDKHSFLFKSGLVETFNMNNKSSRSFYLPSPWSKLHDSAIAQMRIRGDYAGLIRQGRPYLFKIPVPPPSPR